MALFRKAPTQEELAAVERSIILRREARQKAREAVAACPGAVVYGVNPGPPGLGPGIPTAFPPGLVGWAQLGTEKAIAAATVMPIGLCLMLSILSLVVGKQASLTPFLP